MTTIYPFVCVCLDRSRKNLCLCGYYSCITHNLSWAITQRITNSFDSLIMMVKPDIGIDL